MNRKKKIKGFLALLMALMILSALLPTAAFTEPDTPEYLEDIHYDPVADGDFEPDAYEETDEAIYTEDEPWADWPVYTSPLDQDYEVPFIESIESHIADYGYAYVVTTHTVVVYRAPDMVERIYAITQNGAVLLATEYRTQNGINSLKVWFITEENEVIAGYVAADVVADAVLWDDEAVTMAFTLWSGVVSSDVGEQYAFVVRGEKPGAAHEEPAEDIFINNGTDDEEVIPWEPADEFDFEPFEEPAPVDESDNSEPDGEAEDYDDLTADEEPEPDALPAEVGDYLAVTPKTRAFLGIDENVSDGYDGDLSLGVFVNEATVQVMAIEQDSFGRYWYETRYLFGDDYPDGTMAWVEEGSVYVLASETDETAEQECTVTDYAPLPAPSVPSSKQVGIMALAATTPMIGFSLKSINVPIPSFYVGQTGVHGSSGRDNEYLQIASLPGHGTIYATPHYLDGFVVYCLEHTLPSPGGRENGVITYPTGPFVIVDMDAYRTTPGYSGIVFKDQTIHALAWVLRHTYPFMALDRNDADNLVWSRVAGQFAMREVIKQMEGAQYVRDYWQMENFVRNAGQAPAVYLTYARWLAENGIARGRITGNITVTGKSVTFTGGVYRGTATLTTDADLIRISRSVGSLTGNTAGQDSSYYFLNSGDTITVSSASNPFTITAESVNSDAEEASFLIGIPSVAIQKVLIPTYGAPYKMNSP